MSSSDRKGFSGLPNEMVVKSNRLVQARMSFTKPEHRIIAMLISQLKKGDTSFGEQRIYIRDLIDIPGIGTEALYDRAKEICQRLLDQKVHIRSYTDDGRRRYTGYNCMSKCEYVEGSGYIKAKFNEDMEPFLLQLKERFTMYHLRCFLRLTSQHSMRIYELLKMREGISVLRISVEELREILGLEDSYRYFSEMKYHVLEKAQRELKAKTDIYFTFNVEYEGRSAKRIQFFIHRNEDVIRQLRAEDENLELPNPPSSSDRSTETIDRTRADDAEDDGQISVEDRTDAPSVSAIQVFLTDRTQEEIERFERGELEEIHRQARERAEEANEGRSEIVIKIDTITHMKRIWQERIASVA